MLHSFADIVDFTTSLALIAILSEGYGILYRRWGGSWIAPVALGVLFGLVALAQMSRPIEPMEGLIVDLRNIPVTLAGAFLGLRGLAPALAIAAVARIGIGGVGMEAGVIGILIAGLAGLAWAQLQRTYQVRRALALLMLGGAASLHLLAGLALPPVAQGWFFAQAALPILLINLVAIPLVAAPLKRQKYQILAERRLAAAASGDVGSGLLTGTAFLRELARRVAAEPLGTRRGFLVVRPRHGGWLLTGKDRPLLAEVAQLLRGRLGGAGFTALTADCRIVVPLSAADLAQGEPILADLRRALRDTWFEGYDGGRLHLSADMALCVDPDPTRLFVEARRLVLGSNGEGLETPRRAAAPGGAEACTRATESVVRPATAGMLFAKADLLLSARG